MLELDTGIGEAPADLGSSLVPPILPGGNLLCKGLMVR